MEIKTQFVNTDNIISAEDLVKQKLDKLEEKFEWIIRADVFFKTEPDTYGKGKICEIRISCPGPRIFASSNESSFSTAVQETIKDIEVQLKKRKSEMRSVT